MRTTARKPPPTAAPTSSLPSGRRGGSPAGLITLPFTCPHAVDTACSSPSSPSPLNVTYGHHSPLTGPHIAHLKDLQAPVRDCCSAAAPPPASPILKNNRYECHSETRGLHHQKRALVAQESTRLSSFSFLAEGCKQQRANQQAAECCACCRCGVVPGAGLDYRGGRDS